MRRILSIILLAAAFSGCTGLSGEPEIVATVLPPIETPRSLPGSWQPDLDNGALIFAERCTQCHGDSGDGQGELVLAGTVARPLDLTDRAAMSKKSPLEFFDVITEGRLDQLMPPWKDALSEAERWDVALYSYSLSYDEALLAAGESIWHETCADCQRPALIPPAFSDADYGRLLNAEQFGGALTADETGAVVAFLRTHSLPTAQTEVTDEVEDSASLPHGSISGRVVHGSADGIVPADTVVQLQFGNSEIGFRLAETNLDANMNFRIDGIPLAEDFRYVVSAVYQGRLFSRQLPAAPATDVTLELFDVTEDPAALKVSRIELFIDAIELADLGAGLHIAQLIGFENSSDRIFTSGRGFEDGREAVLLLQFPDGARVMSGDQSGRYVVIEDIESIPDSVIDTLPVPPGDAHQVVLEYFLSWDNGAIIDQTFIYAIDADIDITLADKLSIEDDWLREEPVDKPAEWRTYSGRLRADDAPALRLRISGNPFATSSDDDTVVTQDILLPILVGAGGIIIVLFTGYTLTRRRRKKDADEIDRLVAELARLDEDHDQGRINHDLYHHRRRELKARLAALMAESG